MCRVLALACAFALTACGSSHSGGTPDGPPGGDGSGSNPDGGGGGPTTVTVTLTNRPTNAATFSFIAAYQDGGGAWTVAPAPTGDTYSFPINSAAWGFAWACVPPTFGAARVSLAYFAVTEKSSLTEVVPFGCTDRGGMPTQLTGTVTNLPNVNGGGAFVALFGNRQAQLDVQGQTGTFTMTVASGMHDLVIAHFTLQGGGAGDFAVDSAAVARAVAVSGPTTAPTVDYSTADGKTVAVQVASSSGTARIDVVTRLFSSGGTIVDFVHDTVAPFESNSLGATNAAAGDVYNQQISVTDNGSTATVQRWNHAIAPQMWSAPAGLGGATSTVPTATPYPEISTTWAAYTNSVGYIWDAQQGGVGTSAALEWSAVVGPGYVGSSPRFQMPDLSMLTGWSSAWAFQTGSPVTGSVAAQTSSGGIGDFPAPSPGADGTQRAFVDSRWTVTP